MTTVTLSVSSAKNLIGNVLVASHPHQSPYHQRRDYHKYDNNDDGYNDEDNDYKSSLFSPSLLHKEIDQDNKIIKSSNSRPNNLQIINDRDDDNEDIDSIERRQLLQQRHQKHEQSKQKIKEKKSKQSRIPTAMQSPLPLIKSHSDVSGGVNANRGNNSSSNNISYSLSYSSNTFSQNNDCSNSSISSSSSNSNVIERAIADYDRRIAAPLGGPYDYNNHYHHRNNKDINKIRIKVQQNQ